MKRKIKYLSKSEFQEIVGKEINHLLRKCRVFIHLKRWTELEDVKDQLLQLNFAFSLNGQGKIIKRQLITSNFVYRVKTEKDLY